MLEDEVKMTIPAYVETFYFNMIYFEACVETAGTQPSTPSTGSATSRGGESPTYLCYEKNIFIYHI